jgi:acetoin utilization deacetylase AcuC-like enzyme
MTTGFWWDEKCFWHSGGNYTFVLPVGGLVQPLAAGGLPESPETKRRLKNLIEVTGLIGDLAVSSAEPASREDLLRVHSADYLERFEALSASGGGELGERTPFGPGGFEIASLSAGLAKAAVLAVLDGQQSNAYALCRPPGHHCTRDTPMGFCLLANIAIATEAALAEKKVGRVAIVDWDVHHGNGTEAIFYDRSDVLTISIHQASNFPRRSGPASARGAGVGEGFNINVPLQPGAGHDAYLYAFRRIVVPALVGYRPDLVIVACGFDASGVDPLSRMLASSDTFAEMTAMMMQIADEVCGGRLVLVHEGGYSEAHVPFCGHAVLERLSGSTIHAADPLLERISSEQPAERFSAFQRQLIDEMADEVDLVKI